MERKQEIAIFGIVVMLCVFIFAVKAVLTGGVVYEQGNVIVPATLSGNVQTVQMSVNNGDYMLTPARVKVNVPVKLVADTAKVYGCYKTVVIPDLGVRKTVSESDNVIEFTPTKAGTFSMTCGMGMAGGQIIVEDESGNAPVASTTPKPSGGSCGIGGGCGCGG